ncbi:MAG: hypothetical protein ABWZ80_01680 [Beijerinckiaceae bacterium]
MLFLTPAALESLLSLALGLAFAGLLASAFEMLTSRRASFRLLETGDIRALASVPVVVFSAPFIILRNTIKGAQVESRPFIFVMAATIIACIWGMMCGKLVLDIVLSTMI